MKVIIKDVPMDLPEPTAILQGRVDITRPIFNAVPDKGKPYLAQTRKSVKPFPQNLKFQ